MHIIKADGVKMCLVDLGYQVFFIVHTAKSSTAVHRICSTRLILWTIHCLLLQHHTTPKLWNLSTSFLGSCFKLSLGRLFVKWDIVLLQKALQLLHRKVPQEIQTVSGMVGMKTSLGTRCKLLLTCLAFFECLTTSTAELIGTLGTLEVHTSPSGQVIAGVTCRTLNAIGLQMSCQTLLLELRVIVIFPLDKLITRQSFMFPLPRPLAFKAHLLFASWTCNLISTSFINESSMTFVISTPTKIWFPGEVVFHELLLA